MTRLGLGAAAQRVLAVASLCPQIKVGVEAAGHYHRPVVGAGLGCGSSLQLRCCPE